MDTLSRFTETFLEMTSHKHDFDIMKSLAFEYVFYIKFKFFSVFRLFKDIPFWNSTITH